MLEAMQPNQKKGHQNFDQWQILLQENIYSNNIEFVEAVNHYFSKTKLDYSLQKFAKLITNQLESLVTENDYRLNLPRLEHYSGTGNKVDTVIHHPNYLLAGNIIYGSGMMNLLLQPGNLLESLCYFYLSSHAGEAGHNCPIACTAGVIRVLQKSQDFDNKQFYLDQLTDPSYITNFTGAQFVTEAQGGSDVGQNDTQAVEDENGNWKITGEKWFCSNCHADLILMTARFDCSTKGTKGLGLFLVPAKWKNHKNHYHIRRLKEKLGTRTMASGEIDFHGAHAIAMGQPEEGFKLLMENVLHLSRIYNSFAASGLSQRAYQIALAYAKTRNAFEKKILHYPLVQENLAKIKTENTAMTSFSMMTAHLQDQIDLGNCQNKKLLVRLMANLSKYITALWTAEHAHHSIDILGGNGAIESFSSLPRLLRDSIVLENWEGTHNTLRMQILRDIYKYKIHETFFDYISLKIKSIAKNYGDILDEKLTILNNQLNKLKTSNPPLQSLIIKDIVQEMAIVFCALALCQTNEKSIDIIKLFLHHHFDAKLSDEDYLLTIKKITSS